MIDTIIFDWSGTLSDDFNCVLNTINKVLADYGVNPITAEYLREHYKADPVDLYRELGVMDSSEDIDNKFSEYFKEQTPVSIPGVDKVLDILHQREKRLMILSAHIQEHLEKEVQEYGFSGFFEQKYILGEAKDKSKVLIEIDGDHEKILFVGDTTIDMEAGNKAGTKTVAVLTGYHSRERLAEKNPNHTIERLEGLLTIVE